MKVYDSTSTCSERRYSDEREADDRLARVLEVVRRPDVNYVSVKLSSIVSQLLTIDRTGSLERVANETPDSLPRSRGE